MQNTTVSQLQMCSFNLLTLQLGRGILPKILELTFNQLLVCFYRRQLSVMLRNSKILIVPKFRKLFWRFLFCLYIEFMVNCHSLRHWTFIIKLFDFFCVNSVESPIQSYSNQHLRSENFFLYLCITVFCRNCIFRRRHGQLCRFLDTFFPPQYPCPTKRLLHLIQFFSCT